jgi:hypothetical protein
MFCSPVITSGDRVSPIQSTSKVADLYTVNINHDWPVESVARPALRRIFLEIESLFFRPEACDASAMQRCCMIFRSFIYEIYLLVIPVAGHRRAANPSDARLDVVLLGRLLTHIFGIRPIKGRIPIYRCVWPILCNRLYDLQVADI